LRNTDLQGEGKGGRGESKNLGDDISPHFFGPRGIACNVSFHVQ